MFKLQTQRIIDGAVKVLWWLIKGELFDNLIKSLDKMKQIFRSLLLSMI